MKVEMIALSKLFQDPANVNTHDATSIDAITASLKRFKQQKPIVIDASNVIRAGNGTFEAARGLGWKTIACVRTDLKGSEATAYAIGDNKSATFSRLDDGRLTAMLAAIRDEDETLLVATGFKDKDVNDLLRRIAADSTPVGLPDLKTAKVHQITISYKIEDEDSIRQFVGQADDGPLSPTVGKQILGRIKEFAEN